MILLLPMVLNAIANQIYLPYEVIIYDDGDRIDFRNHPVMKYSLYLLDIKNIKWKVVFGEGKGQVKNHQLAIKDSVGDWIWRLDDDTIPEPNVLSVFVKHINLNNTIGAIGGLVPEPNNFKYNTLNSSKIEDIFLGLNVQWFKQDKKSIIVDHLYSTFMYRKDLTNHGYDMRLSKVGFREETMFSYGIKKLGYDLVVATEAITWHFKQEFGGIRNEKIRFIC